MLRRTRQRGLRPERLALVRLYACRSGYDVALVWLDAAVAKVRHLPSDSFAERKAKAEALMQAIHEIRPLGVRSATPSRV